jgi:hypothetical protein
VSMSGLSPVSTSEFPKEQTKFDNNRSFTNVSCAAAVSLGPALSIESSLDSSLRSGCALIYYPYIHIRDVNWLKATFLCFPHARRIIPAFFRVQDHPEVQRFREIEGTNSEPLLDSEYVDAGTSESPIRPAQQRLVRAIQNEAFVLQKYSVGQSDWGVAS